MNKKRISWFMEKKLLVKDPLFRGRARNYLEKAESNLVTMSLLYDLYSNKDALKALKAPEKYDPGEWVVSCGYYAMYMAAMSALAKIGYRSKNHTATVLALDNFFVKKEKLEQEYLKMLENAQLEKEHIETLQLAKDMREIAQYSVTKETTRNISDDIKNDAYKFVRRFRKLVETLE